MGQHFLYKGRDKPTSQCNDVSMDECSKVYGLRVHAATYLGHNSRCTKLSCLDGFLYRLDHDHYGDASALNFGQGLCTVSISDPLQWRDASEVVFWPYTKARTDSRAAFGDGRWTGLRGLTILLFMTYKLVCE